MQVLNFFYFSKVSNTHFEIGSGVQIVEEIIMRILNLKQLHFVFAVG